MLNTVDQCLSILASFSFPDDEAPRYVKGITLNISFTALGMIISLSMSAYYRWQNVRRDKVEGGRPPVGEVLNEIEEHDLMREFRYTL